jgi:hypothetical protein
METTIDADKILNYIQDQSKTLDALSSIVKTIKENKGNVFTLSSEHLSILSDLNLKSNPKTDIIELNTNKKPKNPNFSAMMATNLDRISNNFKFKKENDFSWENLAFKAQLSYEVARTNIADLHGKGSILLQKLKIDLKSNAQKYGVVVRENKITSGVNKFFETIILIGNKISVNKLNKQFKHNLELIGFEAQDLFQPTTKTFLNAEQVEKKIDDKLSKNLNLQKNEDSYSFTILNGLTGDRKFEMISKVIWPQLAKELGQSMSLAISLSDLLNKNKDIKSLLSFSKKNNLHTDIIIHSLKHNPDILSNYPGFKNLVKDKDVILSSSDKYGTLIQNNVVILNSLVKATGVLKNDLFGLDNENAKKFIEEINNFTVATKMNKDTKQEISYSLSKIEENIVKVSKEQTSISKPKM